MNLAIVAKIVNLVNYFESQYSTFMRNLVRFGTYRLRLDGKMLYLLSISFGCSLMKGRVSATGRGEMTHDKIPVRWHLLLRSLRPEGDSYARFTKGLPTVLK